MCHMFAVQMLSLSLFRASQLSEESLKSQRPCRVCSNQLCSCLKSQSLSDTRPRPFPKRCWNLIIWISLDWYPLDNFDDRNEAQFDSQIFRGPELVSNMWTPLSARVWRLAHIFQDHFRDPNNGPPFPYTFTIMESWEADISRWEAADGKLMFPPWVPSQLAPFSRRHPKPYEFLLVK